MSHNALIRGGTGSGSWTGVVVTTTDMETFDQRQFESINGDQGGTWAPGVIINIGGAGLQVSGDVFDCATGASFHSGLFITAGDFNLGGGGTAHFSGAVSVDGQLNITGTAAIVTFTGSSLLVGAGTTFASNALLTLTAGLTVSTGAITAIIGNFSGAVSVAGNFTMTGTTAAFAAGTTTIYNGVVALQTNGHVQSRPFTLATPSGSFLDSNTTISVGTSGGGICTGDIFQPGTLTANRVWTVVSTGIGDGSTLEASLIDCPPGFTVTLVREDSSAIITLLNAPASAFYGCKLVKKSGAWAVQHKHQKF